MSDLPPLFIRVPMVTDHGEDYVSVALDRVCPECHGAGGECPDCEGRGRIMTPNGLAVLQLSHRYR